MRHKQKNYRTATARELHLVAKLQMMITTLLQIPEIEPLTIIPNYVLGTSLTRWWMGAIVDKLFQPTKQTILEEAQLESSEIN